MPLPAPIRRFHRYRGYDYSRGAAMFLTFHLEPRIPVFGKVVDGRMEYSEVGMIARRVLARERDRTPAVQLKRSIIMPEHVHLRLYLRPGQKEPLRKLGQFVYNFKAWTRNHAKKIGVEIRWQKNYHDRICLSREIITLVDKYIDNNPRKWSLMNGNPPPLKVVEPLASEFLRQDEWWTGVGRTDWLSAPCGADLPACAAGSGRGAAESGGHLEGTAHARAIPRFAAVRLSRTIPAAKFGEVTDRLLKAAEMGWHLAGTWISPCERVVFAELVRRGFPIVRGSQDPLQMVYRPKDDESRLFSEGRYLLLSRVFAEGTPRGVGWHGMNDALAGMALAGGGVSAYVRWDRQKGLKWDFGRSAPGGADLPACAAGSGCGAAASDDHLESTAQAGANLAAHTGEGGAIL